MMISHSKNLPNDVGTIPLYHSWLTLTPLSFATMSRKIGLYIAHSPNALELPAHKKPHNIKL